MLKKLLLTILFCPLSLLAQNGPAVYDYSKILTNEISALNAEILALEKETSAELAVVTVYSLEDKSIESYAYELFNRWGIGKKDKNNGILFLTAVGDRRTRIEVGYGLEKFLTDDVCGEILDTYAIPHFKSGNYEKGITETTRAIIKVLKENPAAASGQAGSTPWYSLAAGNRAKLVSITFAVVTILFLVAGIIAAKRNSYSILSFTAWLIIILLLGAAAIYFYTQATIAKPSLFLGGAIGTLIPGLIYNFRQFRRYRPHHCNKCGAGLTLLSENIDDQELSPSQLLEEQLGAVDYDIWFCPACLNKQKEKHITFFSGFLPCPKCTAQTYKETSTVAVAATTSNSGLMKVDGHCRACNFKNSHTRVIPRITRSSSGSSGSGGGGSFGGGSSGGGGSSRSW